MKYIKVPVYIYSAHYHKNKFLFSLIIKNTSLLTMISFKVNPSRLSEIKPVCPYLNNIISVKGMHPATHYNIDRVISPLAVSTQTMLPA